MADQVMPSVGRFLSLLEALSRRDSRSIAEVVREVADEERKHKHYAAAHQLLEALEVAISNTGYDRIATVAAPASPISAPPFDFVDREDLSDLGAPALSPELQGDVRELIEEWQFEAKLRAGGLAPRHTVLLHGPPGCGKTHLARYLAGSLEMPLYVVRFDGLISSYLGETAARIRQLFSFIAANRCALLVDEIDAIAKLRDDRNELGELKRVVIALLQNLDRSPSRSLLLAATNHPHVLDPALWRRFEVVWQIGVPSAQVRLTILEQALGQSVPDLVRAELEHATEGASGADLVQIGLAARRRLLMRSNLPVAEALFLGLIDRLRRSDAGDKDNRIDQLSRAALALREVPGGRRYSFQELETLTGISHSTLHHRAKQERDLQ